MFERFLLIPFPAVHPYQGFLDELIIGNEGLRVNKKVAGDALISILNQRIRRKQEKLCALDRRGKYGSITDYELKSTQSCQISY